VRRRVQEVAVADVDGPSDVMVSDAEPNVLPEP
jgi:hypothetical protein